MNHRRLSALLLAGALAVGLSACGPQETVPSTAPTATPTPEPTPTPTQSLSPIEHDALKVGFLYPGDFSDVGYTHRLSQGADEMQAALNLADEQIVERYNVGTQEDCAQALEALTEAGCQLIFSTSAQFADDVTQAAQKNPDVQFCQLAGDQAAASGLDNLHDFYAALYEGSYLAGIVAGLKAQELGNPRLGYVASVESAAVISDYTAFYLGAKSVWSDVVMEVTYTGSWTDTGLESQLVRALVNRGCGVLGQSSASVAAAATAEEMGAFHVGSYLDLHTMAPGAALISVDVDWGVYFTEAAQALLDGTAIPTDWCKGLADEVVSLTPLNEDLSARGTIEAVSQAEEAIKDGSLSVFTGPLSGENAQGETLDLAEGEVYDESDVANGGGSAPTFDYIVDGITIVSGKE